jgi:hypothetical protein
MSGTTASKREDDRRLARGGWPDQVQADRVLQVAEQQRRRERERDDRLLDEIGEVPAHDSDDLVERTEIRPRRRLSAVRAAGLTIAWIARLATVGIISPQYSASSGSQSSGSGGHQSSGSGSYCSERSTSFTSATPRRCRCCCAWWA